MTLLLRTDKPQAELYLYNGINQLDSVIWEAHRQLAETIHQKAADLLRSNGLSWSDVSGVACFRGPGSFTGLRIGLTVANALANSLKVPIVAVGGEDWKHVSLQRLASSENELIAVPDYGRPARITQQKK